MRIEKRLTHMTSILIRENKTMTELKLYTLKEISELLKVTQRTLLSYLKEGKLKGQKIGGKWIISEENLHKFINGD